LKRITALIDTYELSKDIEKLRIKYAYMIERYERSASTDAQNYTISQELMDIAESKKQTVMVPSGTGEMMAISVLNSSYDQLASDATNYQISSSDISHNIDYIKKQLDELENPKFSEFQRATAIRQTNEEVAALEKSIGTWVTRITQVAQEYFEDKYDHAVTMAGPAKTVYPLSLTKALAIFILVFATVTLGLFRFTKEDKLL